MSIKYYFYMIDNVIGSLKRVNLDSDPIILERWDAETRKWIFSPETIAITGLGSDADSYKEISKQEAEKYIKKRSIFKHVRKADHGNL